MVATKIIKGYDDNKSRFIQKSSQLLAKLETGNSSIVTLWKNVEYLNLQFKHQIKDFVNPKS